MFKAILKIQSSYSPFPSLHPKKYLQCCKKISHSCKCFVSLSLRLPCLLVKSASDYSIVRYCKTFTSVSPGDSLDSSVHQKEASLLNPAGHCYSGPALSERCLRIVELKTKSHNTEQWDYSYIACEEKKTTNAIVFFY